MSQTAAGNKYLDNGDDDSSDDDNDYNVHEVVRTGTFVEVKEVISRDRPRLVAVKDDVSVTSIFLFVLFVHKINSLVELFSIMQLNWIGQKSHSF